MTLRHRARCGLRSVRRGKIGDCAHATAPGRPYRCSDSARSARHTHTDEAHRAGFAGEGAPAPHRGSANCPSPSQRRRPNNRRPNARGPNWGPSHRNPPTSEFGPKRRSTMLVQMSRVGGEAEILCSIRALPVLTHIGPQRKAALRFIFTKSLFARLQTQPVFPETEIVR
jgi:hypothetical protein